MREAGVTVEGDCRNCGRRAEVDLYHLGALRGPHATLVDHRPPCGDCGASGRFLARLDGIEYDMLTPDCWGAPVVCGWRGGAMGAHYKRPWWLPELKKPQCQGA